MAMLDKVYNDKEDPADVAADWLADNGLDANGSAASGESLTVGSANFPENVILAEIYAQVLEAQGAKVGHQAQHRQPGEVLSRRSSRDRSTCSRSTPARS